MVVTPIIEALGWRGITIPPNETRTRVVCPECSPFRFKQHRRTLRVRLLSATDAEMSCAYPECKYQEDVTA